jgi:hypothetical protein
MKTYETRDVIFFHGLQYFNRYFNKDRCIDALCRLMEEDYV